ncbi:hypothetical protein GWI33_016554 [Rhynchophorus ferrugineus]|uniref:tRNA/rRNA methyltransferase SpoU type domain-containing protein n=1 Tax=Rhynchophorus ferrugineus TaxID=354439 RepID=A0A834I126_RHYFE|nr:hypothetical protein GWI33_016554 [Rhynchophorus ferrugineus]
MKLVKKHRWFLNKSPIFGNQESCQKRTKIYVKSLFKLYSGIIIKKCRNEVLLCIYEHLIHFVNVSEAPELVIKFINTCHARLSNLKKDFYFKKILINFVNTIYSVEYLSKSKESAFLMSDSLLEYSKAYPVVRLHMITAIKKIIKCDDIYGGSEWLTTIVDIYLQGVITTKDERTEYFICQEFLEINKSFVFENIINISEQSNPNIINTACRIISLDAILDLAKNSVAKVIISLRTEYLKFFKKRYFPNSETHIKKLRITQALLLILPYVKEFSKEAIQIGVFLLDCILEEANQPCIKQIFNLVLIILLQGAAFRGIEYIKRVMSMSAQVSPSIQIGLMPTFYHLALFDTEDPMRSFSAVMSLVLPWTMGSQFKVRIYAQDIIKRLIHEAKENNYDDFLNKYQHLESCIDTSIKATGPIKLSHLNSLTEKTLLEPKDPSLSIAIDKYLENATKNDNQQDKTEALNLNIQKKITPWKNISEGNDIPTNSEFILVATLVDKPQNLGGLSRTCEAFGIPNLVLNDAKIVQNKEFQSLSMSSEGWINITEIKIKDLREHIMDYKREGYFVVGAEQTTNSIKLNEFRFPRKTVLILGNEKTGIAANLIPILDKCIEIPQFGQTRSLNVHVAGATIIWEYVKEHSLRPNHMTA